MNNEPEDVRVELKRKWLAFPQWLKSFLIILAILTPPVGWIIGIGLYIWLFCWD